MRDTKVHTALAHRLEVAIKAFVLCEEKTDDIARGIINCPMEGVFRVSAKPFIGSSIYLDELAGVWFSRPPGCGFRVRRGVVFASAGVSGDGFFSFWGFQNLHFLVYWKVQNRKERFQNLRAVCL